MFSRAFIPKVRNHYSMGQSKDVDDHWYIPSMSLIQGAGYNWEPTQWGKVNKKSGNMPKK